MGQPPRRILILLIGSLYFLIGCAQVQQVKEGFVDGWEETKKAVGAGKDSKTSKKDKKDKPADSGDKTKETPAPKAEMESKEKKPAESPSGLFGPK